jgi:hypothetical protein
MRQQFASLAGSALAAAILAVGHSLAVVSGPLVALFAGFAGGQAAGRALGWFFDQRSAYPVRWRFWRVSSYEAAFGVIGAVAGLVIGALVAVFGL